MWSLRHCCVTKALSAAREKFISSAASMHILKTAIICESLLLVLLVGQFPATKHLTRKYFAVIRAELFLRRCVPSLVMCPLRHRSFANTPCCHLRIIPASFCLCCRSLRLPDITSKTSLLREHTLLHSRIILTSFYLYYSVSILVSHLFMTVLYCTHSNKQSHNERSKLL